MGQHRGNLADRGLDIVGDRHADGVVQPPGLGGQPVQEPVRAAGVGPDRDLPPQVTRELRDREPGRLDAIGGGVGVGVPGPEHDREGFPVPGRAVVGQAVTGCPRPKVFFQVGAACSFSECAITIVADSASRVGRGPVHDSDL